MYTPSPQVDKLKMSNRNFRNSRKKNIYYLTNLVLRSHPFDVKRQISSILTCSAFCQYTHRTNLPLLISRYTTVLLLAVLS